MKISKSIELAWNILANSKLRSWLTIIGIVIGIAAVVSIVSISNGAQEEMKSRFDEFGADIITLTPGASRAFRMGPPDEKRFDDSSSSNEDQNPITNKDLNIIKTVSNVDVISPKVSASGEIQYLGDSGDVTITGIDAETWEDVSNDELESGRYLTQADTYSVILGYKRAHEYFTNEVSINRKITIEGKQFKVVGVFADGENDQAVIIPISAATTVLEDVDANDYDAVLIKVKDADLLEDTMNTTESKLMLSRGILNKENKDFSLSSSKEMQQTISETLNTMAIFLGAIAAISLIVGAVGISNTMFTSVVEKTKQIGVMKAIGAKNRDILGIFLLNSGMIGFVGGIGGVLLGAVASSMIGNLTGSGGGGGMMRMFSSTALTPELLISAFLFSILIGMIAGAIPAYRASKLKPVDALRYE